MPHKGNLYDVPQGAGVIVTSPIRIVANLQNVPVAATVCDACGFISYLGEFRSRANEAFERTCRLLCVCCGQPEDNHAGDCCLFGPTRFTALRYEITVVPPENRK